MSDSLIDAGPLTRPNAEAYYARIRGLLLAPVAEWTKIAAERPTLRHLFLFWVIPFSLVFLLAPQLGAMAFEKSLAPSLAVALYTVIVGTLFMAGGVWALAWIADYLAPTFGGRRDPDQALKLAAYSGTGLWLSGLIGLAPPLILLGAVGIVSVYTLYRGLPVLMHAPEDKALPYAAAIVGSALVMFVVLTSLSSCANIFGGPPALAPKQAVVVAPAKAKAASPDPSGAIDPEKMRRLIPEAIPGGWVRADLSRNAGGVLGFTGPTVEATFENGGRRVVLKIVDLGSGRAANSIAALRALQPTQDDPKRLVVHSDVGGRYVFTETDRVGGAERWLTVVGDRIALYAEGRGGVTQGQLQEAVALIDMVRVEQIARGM